MYSKTIASEFGAIEALVYSQIQYWLERATRFFEGVPWVYKSAKELADELGLSAKQVRRAAVRLCEAGLLKKARLDAAKWRQVCFYSYGNPETPGNLDLPSRETRDIPTGQIEISLEGNSNTEITPDITSKNYSHSPEAGSERESNFLVEETQAMTEQASPIEVIAEPQARQSVSPEQPKPYPEDKCSALSFAKEKSKEFRDWLVKLATRLDKRDPVSWAVVVSRNPDPVILEQFERYLSPPVPTPAQLSPPAESSTPPEPEQTQLARLQAKWSMPVPWVGKLRREVAAEIAANPQWGIVCRNDGPALLEF